MLLLLRLVVVFVSGELRMFFIECISWLLKLLI